MLKNTKILSTNMGEPRVKLGYELNDRHAYSLRDATPHLKSLQFNPEREYFEFLIAGEVNPDYIKSLLTLPYEISLTEMNGRIVLTTGLKHENISEKDFINRRDNSKVSIHTHPVYGRKILLTTPSFADVSVSDLASKETTLGLVHANGLMVYRRPISDPGTAKSCKKTDVRDVMLTYCKNRGIDVFGFGRKELKQYEDLSYAEQVRLQRQFVEETKMIVDEASWDDKKGVERVLSRLFSRINQ